MLWVSSAGLGLEKTEPSKLIASSIACRQRFGDAHLIFGGDMAERAQQSSDNHARWDPLFHFFVLPVLFITFITAIVQAVRHPGFASAWNVVFIAALTIAATKIRTYALKVQDRVIRLEERLRLATLIKEPLRARIDELSAAQ